MHRLHYKDQMYKNQQMGIEEAKIWLAFTNLGSPTIEYVLAQIAHNQYPNVTKNIDRFIKVLISSKHSENEQMIEKFFKELDEVLLLYIELNTHAQLVVKSLLKNPRWSERPELIQKLQEFNRD